VAKKKKSRKKKHGKAAGHHSGLLEASLSTAQPSEPSSAPSEPFQTASPQTEFSRPDFAAEHAEQEVNAPDEAQPSADAEISPSGNISENSSPSSSATADIPAHITEDQISEPPPLAEEITEPFAAEHPTALSQAVPPAQEIPPSGSIEEQAIAADIRYASLWRRAAAAGYDILFVALVCIGIFGGSAGWLLYSFSEPLDLAGKNNFHPEQLRMRLAQAALACFVFIWLYSALLEFRWIGGTIGKLLFSIRVADKNGKPLGFFRANLRFFCKLASIATLGLGLFLAIFRRDRQTFHDRLAHTIVIFAGQKTR
jgi:uncharacterized RDD family membrane protein YckC